MAKIQLVIEISENIYNNCKNFNELGNVSVIERAIANGIPLPEEQRTYYTIAGDRYEYGGYETLQDALEFFKQDSKAESIIKTFETREIVYEPHKRGEEDGYSN